MSGQEGSALAVVIAASHGQSGAMAPDLAQVKAFSDQVRQRRHRMLALCKLPEAKGLVGPNDFDTQFNTLEGFTNTGELSGPAVDRTLAALDDAILAAENNVAWTRQEQQRSLRDEAAFSERSRALRQHMTALCSLPDAKGVVAHTDFDKVFGVVEGLRDGGQRTGDAVAKGFAAIEQALDEASKKVAAASAAAAQRVREQQIFSDRKAGLAARADALGKTPDAEGVVGPADFATVLGAIDELDGKGQFAGPEVEQAFVAADAAMDKAAEKVAHAVEAAETLRQEKTAFRSRQAELQSRASVVTAGGFAEPDPIDAAVAALDKLYDAGTLTDEAAFTKLEELVTAGEAQAAKYQRQVDLYALTLDALGKDIAALEKDSYVADGDLDEVLAARTEAEALAGKSDFDGAQLKLKAAAKLLAKVTTAAATAREFAEKRGDYIAQLCAGPLQSLKVSPSDLESGLGDEQFTALAKLAKRLATASSRQSGIISREIRDTYKEFVAANEAEAAAAEDEEEEPTPAPVVAETSGARLARIDEQKKKNKNVTTLIMMDAESEIFKTRLVFANKSSGVVMGGYLENDWVMGYDVLFRNGPGGVRYDKMIVHFHFSDKEYSKLTTAHFKKSHAGADHDHWSIKTADMSTALSICENWR